MKIYLCTVQVIVYPYIMDGLFQHLTEIMMMDPAVLTVLMNSVVPGGMPHAMNPT